MSKKAIKTRGDGKYTESQFWGKIRGGLRREFRFWPPILQAKNKARRTLVPKRGNQKYEYQCAHCKEWMKGSEVQVDHIIPCGALRCMGDIPGFIERLTVEDGFQLLCKGCHKIKTNRERKNG